MLGRRRYEWRESDFHSECWCVDLLTGKEVCRYDLGDPADYDPNYGGHTEREMLEMKGFDPDERLPLTPDAHPTTRSEGD
jgi:hypothetical protein